MFVNNQSMQTFGQYPSFPNNLPNSSTDVIVHQNHYENNNLVSMLGVQNNFQNVPNVFNQQFYQNTNFVNNSNVNIFPNHHQSFGPLPYFNSQVCLENGNVCNIINRL